MLPPCEAFGAGMGSRFMNRKNATGSSSGSFQTCGSGRFFAVRHADLDLFLFFDHVQQPLTVGCVGRLS